METLLDSPQAEVPHWTKGRRPLRGVDPRWRRDFGETVRYRRRQLGLTLEQLAAQCAMSKPYLSLIETARNPGLISDGKVQALAKALGFDAQEMLARQYLATIPRELWAPVAKLIEE